MRNKGKVISKKELFEKVWEDKFTGDGTLNVHIRRLREAIESTPKTVSVAQVYIEQYEFGCLVFEKLATIFHAVNGNRVYAKKIR